MNYAIRTTGRRVEKEIARLPERDREAVLAAILALAEDPRPHGTVRLGQDIYRLRVGDYRVIYKVYDAHRLVRIGRVRRRSESTYAGFREIFPD
jgi:mRNA interferase RelE/StbE